MIETAVSDEMYCVECGYDLRQLASDRCPECGIVIDRTMVGQSVIPWRQRARIGWFRGFWATVWIVTRRPHVFAAEMNRPGDLAAALRFRLIVVVHAMTVVGPVALIGVYALAQDPEWLPVFHAADPLGSAVSAFGLLCVLGGAWVFLMCATGVCSYFYYPRTLSAEQQNRAIILSYYACAPLAFAPLVALFCVMLMAILGKSRWYMSLEVRMVLLIVVAPLPLLLWVMDVWRAPVRLMRVATRCGVHRQAALRIFLPVAWALLAGLFVIVIPAMLVAICLAVATLLS